MVAGGDAEHADRIPAEREGDAGPRPAERDDPGDGGDVDAEERDRFPPVDAVVAFRRDRHSPTVGKPPSARGHDLVMCPRVAARLAVVGCFLLCGCSSEESEHAPIARITAQPRAIPQGDDYMTDVVLDGSESSDPIDDPDGGLPLTYLWEVSGDGMRLQGGSTTSPSFTARFQG